MAKRSNLPIPEPYTGGMGDQPDIPTDLPGNDHLLPVGGRNLTGMTGVGTQAAAKGMNADLDAATSLISTHRGVEADDRKQSDMQKADAFQKEIIEKYPGSMQGLVDQITQADPELGKSITAEFASTRDLVKDPSLTPEQRDTFIANQTSGFVKRFDERQKEKTKNELGPVFEKWKSEHGDPFVSGKSGKLKAEDLATLATTAPSSLSGYAPYEKYIDNLKTQPNVRYGTDYSIPFTELELYGLAEDVKNGDLIENVLPKTRMPPPLYAAARHALLAMIRGTYKKGSYKPPKGSSGGGGSAGGGGAGGGSPTPGITPPASEGAPADSTAMPDYNPTTDKGDATYANNPKVKTAVAAIKNAKATLKAVGEIFAGLDRTRFPTINKWLNSSEKAAGGVRAQIADVVEIILSDEAGPAFSRGGVTSNQKTEMANKLGEALKNASPDAARGILEQLDHGFDRTIQTQEAPSGRFARKEPKPAAAPKLPTKASTDAEIAAWLKSKNKDASPKSVGMIRKKLGG